MAVDTPATIAVIGAGPLGLEAALYARYLGYDVEVFERGEVAAHVRRWGHVRMFTPFHLNCSPLGLAALAAQNESYEPPDENALLTGDAWVERYLLPLAQTDLLADHIHERHEVVSLSRTEVLKVHHTADRRDLTIRLLVQDAAGGERSVDADVVLDTSGVYGQPNALGPGGAPAIGERTVRDRIWYQLPDPLGKDRARFAGRHSLLVGGGMSAATTARAIGELAAEVPQTRLTWIIYRETPEHVPFAVAEEDPLPARKELVTDACRLVREHAALQFCDETWVEAVAWGAETGFVVTLAGKQTGPFTCDEIVAHVGFRPDRELFRELLVHECYATEGPMRLAACLGENATSDCMDQQSHGAASLVNPEPDFYILGAKSYGRRSNFLFSVGLQQIRELFTLLGDRPTLNLYER